MAKLNYATEYLQTLEQMFPYEAEMQRILEDGKKLGLKFEKKKEEK